MKESLNTVFLKEQTLTRVYLVLSASIAEKINRPSICVTVSWVKGKAHRCIAGWILYFLTLKLVKSLHVPIEK